VSSKMTTSLDHNIVHVVHSVLDKIQLSSVPWRLVDLL
jgi:hypothetical protein